MLPLALVLAGCVGVVVGLLGGGGSVLTVPLLVFGLGLAPSSAITMSLLVVGMTNAAALVPHALARRVCWRTGLLFAPAGMAGAFVGGTLGHRLPDGVVMTLFAVMMALSAWGMLRPRAATACAAAGASLPRIIVLGAACGLLTGLIGASGGFVIVPVLVCLIGLPVHAAVGTSLLVITLNALAAVAARIGQVDVDWTLTAMITAVAAVGAVVGSRLSGRVSQDALRRGFGWLVVAMAALVLFQQIP
jgi:uncharacterized membrane protein YfcA